MTDAQTQGTQAPADGSGAAQAVSPRTAGQPDVANHEAPFDLPGTLDLPRCPDCKIGLLYPIAVDEDATHENQPRAAEGDPTGHPHFVASGGAMRLFCFNCQRGSSQPMNAGGQ